MNREAHRFGAQLDEIEALLAEGRSALETRAEKVSGWSVGEQIDHLTKVAQFGFDRLARSPAPLPRGINVTGRVLLALGWLPRGVGKAPKAALPDGASGEELAARVAALRAATAAVAARPEVFASRTPIIPHPYFGGLTPAQGLCMLVVHTEHHLKIVRDIRRAAAGTGARSAS